MSKSLAIGDFPIMSCYFSFKRNLETPGILMVLILASIYGWTNINFINRSEQRFRWLTNWPLVINWCLCQYNILWRKKWGIGIVFFHKSESNIGLGWSQITLTSKAGIKMPGSWANFLGSWQNFEAKANLSIY